MKIIYMGTPDFAVPPLKALAEAGHEMLYAVTRPDAAAKRGKKVLCSPVKEAAAEAGIPVLQPVKIRGNEEFINTLKEAAPDVIVVCAYGMILPQDILDIPARGCLNIHGSLLPRFRGAAPIQGAILAGDEVTGITIMQMEAGLDTGPMLCKDETPIGGKSCGELHDELSRMGARLITAALEQLDEIEPEEQDDSLATYAGMISKADGRADFTKSPEELERQIRAFDPWPGTFTSYGEQTLKLWAALPLQDACGEPAGTVVAVSDQGIDISAGGRILRVTKLQAPGRRRMETREYLKGNSIEIGTVLG